MSAVESIALERLVEFAAVLGLDPRDVLSIQIEPREITAEVLVRDADGKITLTGGKGGPRTEFVAIEVVQ